MAIGKWRIKFTDLHTCIINVVVFFSKAFKNAILQFISNSDLRGSCVQPVWRSVSHSLFILDRRIIWMFAFSLQKKTNLSIFWTMLVLILYLNPTFSILESAHFRDSVIWCFKHLIRLMIPWTYALRTIWRWLHESAIVSLLQCARKVVLQTNF